MHCCIMRKNTENYGLLSNLLPFPSGWIHESTDPTFGFVSILFSLDSETKSNIFGLFPHDESMRPITKFFVFFSSGCNHFHVFFSSKKHLSWSIKSISSDFQFRSHFIWFSDGSILLWIFQCNSFEKMLQIFKFFFDCLFLNKPV